MEACNNILVVDDDEIDRRSILRLIKRERPDMFIAEAATAKEGVVATATETFDVILLDYSLPDMVGLEALLAIRKATGGKIPVVMLSGMRDQKGITVECIKAGAQDFLVKEEVTVDVVERSIRYAIHRQEIESQLRIAVLEAQHANSAKSNFISNVSHELRTPFTSIKGSLDLIIGGVFPGTPVEVIDLLKVASRNTDHLLNVVNDLLDIDKIEHGKNTYDITEQNIFSLAKEGLDLTKGFADQLGKVIHLSVPEFNIANLTVHADRQRVVQIIVNLVSNAIKFSRENIHIEFSSTDSKMIELSVKDDGIGIPLVLQPRVFESFFQAHRARPDSLPSTGLGLTICKQMLEDMGGEIGFESEPNESTRFYIRLPRLQVIMS